MHTLVLLILVACDASLGYYDRGYESHNLIEREVPANENEGVLVECPVCDVTDNWMPSNEMCPIVKGNKTYKKCEHGIYKNSVCGNRPDCFRGPGEHCTEKRVFDHFGQRCAPGYYCNGHVGLCQGIGYVEDSRVLYTLNRTPYTFGQRHKGGLEENAFIRSD